MKNSKAIQYILLAILAYYTYVKSGLVWNHLEPLWHFSLGRQRDCQGILSSKGTWCPQNLAQGDKSQVLRGKLRINLLCFYVMIFGSCKPTVFVHQIAVSIVLDQFLYICFYICFNICLALSCTYSHVCTYKCVNWASNHFWDTAGFNSSPLMSLPCHWLFGPVLSSSPFRPNKAASPSRIHWVNPGWALWYFILLQ